MTPKWRCRERICGYEWDDTPPSPEELVEELRLEADRRERELRREEEGHQRERQLRLEEEERRHNDQAELEALRLRADGWERQLRRDAEIADLKDRGKSLGFFGSLAGFIAGLLIGNLLFLWSPPEAFIFAVFLGVAGYCLVDKLVKDGVIK